MRIKGPGSGPPQVNDATESAPIDAGRAVQTGGATEVARPNATTPTDATDSVGDVARRLRAGEISGREAVELLIDEAVQRRVGALPSEKQALASELKELLRRYSETDPYLAEKVRRLDQK